MWLLKKEIARYVMPNSTEAKTKEPAQPSAELQSIVSRKEAIEKGLKHYFTGKSCKNDHQCNRLTISRHCVDCKRNDDKYPSKERKAYILTHQRKPVQKAKARVYAKRPDRVLIRRDQERRIYNSNIEQSRIKAMNKYEKGKIAILKNKSIRTKEKRANDPDYKLREHTSNSVNRVIRAIGCNKNIKSLSLVDYSQSELKQHIEKQFDSNMNWNNWGHYWELDHIVSVSKLILSGVKDPSKINALSNLQPIKKIENRIKSNKDIYLL